MNRLKGTAPSDIFSSVAFNSEERRYLERLAGSRHVGDRKLCLEYLRNSVLVHSNRNFVLGLLDQLAGDKNVDVSDLALFLAGEFIREHPRKAWPLIVKYASRQSWLMRQMVAACFLEHLLEFHFGEYFPKVERLVLGGDTRFLYTLACCYRLGEAKEHEAEIDALIRKARAQSRRLRSKRHRRDRETRSCSALTGKDGDHESR